MNRAILLGQARKYARSGVGLAGALLKHSLYPMALLRRVLPDRGLVLDLGSGDGMLGNLLASTAGGIELRGVDLDSAKVELACRNAPLNASYAAGDVVNQSFRSAAAAIFNDVLHHHPYAHQERLLQKAADFLDPGGVLIVKEVDADDGADRTWTTFWDRRLYPADRLHFRTARDWQRVLVASGFEVLETTRVRHPWPASRTVLVARKAPLFHPAGARGGPKVAVLVTGATGFLGRHLARHLLARGLDGMDADVTLLVRDPGRLPPDLASTCRIVHGGLESPELGGWLTAQHYVFHLAADKDFFGGRKVFESNVRGTEALLAALAGAGALRRLVFASSMGAIDRAAADPCTNPLDEESRAYPASEYGRAKYACEQKILQSGVPATILRLPWCYGPDMSAGTHIRSLAEMTARGSLLSRFDWPGKVSVLQSSECCRALAFAAAHPEAHGQTFFVCDPEAISFGALFREMGAMTGQTAGSRGIPGWVCSAAFVFRRFLPFTLRSLFLDTLWVSDRRARSLGFNAETRPDLFLLPLARSLSERRYPSRHRSRWVVTGAASGIGRALSLQLAARGHSVAMVDRDASVVEAAAALPGASGHKADLACAEDLEAVARLIESRSVHCVVNCAGVGLRSGVGETDPARLNSMIGVNVQALTLLSEHALRQFRSAGEGLLINLASSAGLQPLSGMAAYSATKAYVMAFSEAAGEEMRGSGVAVLTVCPGGVATRFQERAGVRSVPGETLLTPEEVARAILNAADRGRSATLFVGPRPLFMSLLARLLPRAVNARLWRRLMEDRR